MTPPVACLESRHSCWTRTTAAGHADRPDRCIVGFAVVRGSPNGTTRPGDPARHEDDPAALGASAFFHLAALVEGVSMGPGGLLATSTVMDAALADEAGDRLCRALDRMAATIDS